MGILAVGIVVTLERLLVEPTGWREDAPALFAISRDLTDLAIWCLMEFSCNTT
uniref:Bm9289 n=1 Tax=Brugia malayi TaxID=6279 RepID=A0A1I9G7C5_BRUMA|nr:Bm9289 [Brugia malayi]